MSTKEGEYNCRYRLYETKPVTYLRDDEVNYWEVEAVAGEKEIFVWYHQTKRKEDRHLDSFTKIWGQELGKTNLDTARICKELGLIVRKMTGITSSWYTCL
jgi:hypothetical protein